MIKMSEVTELQLPSWIAKKRDPTRGPWFSSIKLALSDDGLNFEKTHKVLVDRGGVSNLCLDLKGKVIATYQYFSFLQENDFDKIAVSISSDDGETWEGPKVIRFDGFEKLGYLRPCDPALGLLDDGRYRLYCTSDPLDGKRARTYSAISEDGINFKIEEGVRFMDEGNMVLDPAVIKIGKIWHYYAPHQGNPNRNYHAISQDGLNFKREEDIILEMKMLGGASPVEGGYRFFGTGPKGMTAFSTDGYNWIQEDMKTPGPDPGVVKLKNGKYLMSYTTRRKP